MDIWARFLLRIVKDTFGSCLLTTSIPGPLSDIILKLQAKNAEDRYQSARGLQADLHHCLAQVHATGQLESFELGRSDFTSRLQIPQKR